MFFFLNSNAALRYVHSSFFRVSCLSMRVCTWAEWSGRVVSHWPLMNVILAGTSASFSNRTDFPCQCIKLVGKRHLVAALHHELSFANHVHEFDASQDAFGCLK